MTWINVKDQLPPAQMMVTSLGYASINQGGDLCMKGNDQEKMG